MTAYPSTGTGRMSPLSTRPADPLEADLSWRRGFDPLHIKHRFRRTLADKMQAHGVPELRPAEELEDPLAVLELAFEVFVHVVFQFGRDHALAIVVPVGVDAHEQVRFVPVNRVAVNESFARLRRVKPE